MKRTKEAFLFLEPVFIGFLIACCVITLVLVLGGPWEELERLEVCEEQNDVLSREVRILHEVVDENNEKAALFECMREVENLLEDERQHFQEDHSTQ